MNLKVEISCKDESGSIQMLIKEGQKVIVGRSNKEWSLVKDGKLSWEHFQLELKNGRAVLVHLSKTNPTHVSELGGQFQAVKNFETDRDFRAVAGIHKFVFQFSKSPDEKNESDIFFGESDGNSTVTSSPPNEPPPTLVQNDDSNEEFFSFEEKPLASEPNEGISGGSSKPNDNSVDDSGTFDPNDGSSKGDSLDDILKNL